MRCRATIPGLSVLVPFRMIPGYKRAGWTLIYRTGDATKCRACDGDPVRHHHPIPRGASAVMWKATAG